MYKGIGESMTKRREKKLKKAFVPVGDGGERSKPKSPHRGRRDSAGEPLHSRSVRKVLQKEAHSRV